MKFHTEEELLITISKNVKELRKKANLTQAQLCEIAGISLSYLTKIEAPKVHKSVSLSLLNQIANALNVEITEFFKE